MAKQIEISKNDPSPRDEGSEVFKFKKEGGGVDMIRRSVNVGQRELWSDVMDSKAVVSE
jgi:hypothetical protein